MGKKVNLISLKGHGEQEKGGASTSTETTDKTDTEIQNSTYSRKDVQKLDRAKEKATEIIWEQEKTLWWKTLKAQSN